MAVAHLATVGYWVVLGSFDLYRINFIVLFAAFYVGSVILIALVGIVFLGVVDFRLNRSSLFLG